MEMDKKPHCPVVDIDGFIEKGKQFDLEINLPEDNRNVIFGVIKDCFREPVEDAVVKLVEVVYDCGKKDRRPVTHTFTDKEGEFVLGPLCPGKEYALEIFVNDVKHVKICAKCHREEKCLKGVKLDKCDKHMKDKCCKPMECKCEKDYGKDYDKDYEKDYGKDYDKDYDKNYDKECKKDHDKECKKDYDKECKKDDEKECKKDYGRKCDMKY